MQFTQMTEEEKKQFELEVAEVMETLEELDGENINKMKIAQLRKYHKEQVATLTVVMDRIISMYEEYINDKTEKYRYFKYGFAFGSVTMTILFVIYNLFIR